jgi:hypothetical protein
LPFYIDEKNIGWQISLLNDEALLGQSLCSFICFFYKIDGKRSSPPHTHTTNSYNNQINADIWSFTNFQCRCEKLDLIPHTHYIEQE